MFSAGDFEKCSGCTAAGIMRQLNAGKTVLLVCIDLDNGRLRIESYRFEESKRTVSGTELTAWWAYSKESVPDGENFTADMCYASDKETWLKLAKEYGRRCVPGIESTYKQFFEWYLTGVHFFNECRKINAKYELFVTDRTDGFCDGLETGFAEFYFDKYYRKDKNR